MFDILCLPQTSSESSELNWEHFVNSPWSWEREWRARKISCNVNRRLTTTLPDENLRFELFNSAAEETVWKFDSVQNGHLLTEDTTSVLNSVFEYSHSQIVPKLTWSIGWNPT